MKEIEIVKAAKMTPGQARYWNSVLKEERGRKVQRVSVIDPWRHTLRQLADMGYSGRMVYRASTGGRWGKSVEIRCIPSFKS